MTSPVILPSTGSTSPRFARQGVETLWVGGDPGLP